MANQFTTVEMQRPKSNVFDLSHDFKLSLNMGNLVPSLVMECVPGDIISITAQNMHRLAPMIAPVMHKVDCYQHFFFVPNRLVWDGWEEFITGGQDPSTVPAAPYIDYAGLPVTSPGFLPDYMGIPVNTAVGKFSALPFAAYQMIFNEYYRDQNLQPEVDYKLVDGNNNSNWSPNLEVLRKRAWSHDYFTSSLPFAQKGQPVTLPLGTFSDVPVYLQNNGTPGRFTNVNGGTASGNLNVNANYGGSSTSGTANNGPDDVVYDPQGTLFADTSALDLQATSINDLRTAIKLQEWLERNARGGSRYIESILSHFGVHSPDARLQRPEYIGGTKQPMVISEVLQTGETNDTPQGNMAGHGLSIGGGQTSRYRCTEHGFIIGIMSVLPRTAYQQGLPRLFSKFDNMLYFWPTFADLGEQEVLNKEVYCDFNDGLNDEVFGYIPRYSEYRSLPSRVAGDFTTTLNYWHMGRIFPSRPALNASFIEANPTHRIFAVTDPAVHKIYSHIFYQIKAIRLIPKYGIPDI